MKALSLTGRILFALPMAVFGFGHLANASAMAGMVPAWVPGGVFWVYLTGIALLAAAVSIIIGKFSKWAGVGLGVLMLVFVFTIFAPMMGSQDQMTQQLGFTGLMKDLSLAGAAFFFAATIEKKD